MVAKIVDAVTPVISKNKPGDLYLNIKAHKLFPHPGRLVTTGCGSYIENISALTAFELKKVDVSYVIVDKQHFLRKIYQLNASGVLSGRAVVHRSVLML